MPELTPELVRAIAAKAVEFGVMEKSEFDQGTDETLLESAKTIVDVVTQASQTGSVNDAVLEILHVAQIAPLSDTTREAYQRRFGAAPATANGQPATTSQPSAPSGTQDVSSSEQTSPVTAETPAAGEIDISSIFPGYDDLKVADIKKAIIASAASGDLSPEEWEKIKAYEAAHEERKTILSLEPEFKAPEPEPEPITNVGAFGQATASSGNTTGAFQVTQHTGGGAPPADGASVEAFYNGETISRAQQEGLPIPPTVSTDQQPVLPIDITNVSDQELSRVATIFHSYFVRTQWLLSQEEGRERAAEHLEHESHRDAYVRAFEMHKSAIPEDKRGPTAIDAARKLAEKDADGAGRVAEFRSKKVRHGIDARELKALALGFDKAVWRINEELDRRARMMTTGRAAS